MADESYLSNQFLVAMPGLEDSNFSHSVTLLCEHSDKGALGLIINRPTDLHPTDATGIFQAGTVTLTFDGTWYTTGSGARNPSVTGLTQSFTVDPAAPGEMTATNSRTLGPLTLQGPSISLADFGFSDGMVVLTIAAGRITDIRGYDDPLEATQAAGTA